MRKPNGVQPTLADDLLPPGVPAIAAYLGWPERIVRYAVDNGRLPTFRVGSRICARRSELDAALRAQPLEAAGPGK